MQYILCMTASAFVPKYLYLYICIALVIGLTAVLENILIQISRLQQIYFSEFIKQALAAIDYTGYHQQKFG